MSPQVRDPSCEGLGAEALDQTWTSYLSCLTKVYLWRHSLPPYAGVWRSVTCNVYFV